MLLIKQQATRSVSLKESVPLKQIHVDARLRSFAADVTLTQVFQNDESVPIEAVYCFPVEENAAVYAFVARIDNEREIVAELKEKKTAQKEYTEALAQGHGAYLFEQDEASNDIFVVSVGALQPGSECCITISYVSELDLLHFDEKPTIRFVIPTTIAPRYSPAETGITSPGGTELLEPLVWLKKNDPPVGFVRQVFLLTDGEVSNVDQVINLCGDMAACTRIFSFGLGHSPSRALVKGLARVTNGHYTFIPPYTNVDVHVAEQLARALRPSIKNLHVKWKINQSVLHSVPKHAPPVFIHDRLLFYAILDESMPFDHETTVELLADMHEQPLSVARVDHVSSALTSQTLVRLAAKTLLQELLHTSEPIAREHIVDLSLKRKRGKSEQNQKYEMKE
ncbi:unnamed protein product [Rotaria sp. Silwood1]|nr:unnamed protein product [Rotaria sp. Silwood1]